MAPWRGAGGETATGTPSINYQSCLAGTIAATMGNAATGGGSPVRGQPNTGVAQYGKVSRDGMVD
jgi:hypothetical protein